MPVRLKRLLFQYSNDFESSNIIINNQLIINPLTTDIFNFNENVKAAYVLYNSVFGKV